MDEWMRERWELAADRILEIRDVRAKDVPEVFRDFFWKMADFICIMMELRREIQEAAPAKADMETLRRKNRSYYEDILPGQYAKSYANPAHASAGMGKPYGQYLSFLYMELRGLIVFAFEKRDWDFIAAMELYLQIYGEFTQEQLAKAESVRRILYWYISDYCQDMVEYRLREKMDPSCCFAKRIVMEADLTNPSYLYQYGEYVTEEEERTAADLAALSQEEIDARADSYIKTYLSGICNTERNVSKKTVEIRYRLGWERLVRAVVVRFDQMGLQTVMPRRAVHAVFRGHYSGIGYYGAVPNRQCDHDHSGDAGLFLDEEYVQRRLRATQEIYEACKTEASKMAGFVVIGAVGDRAEEEASRKCADAIRLHAKQQRLQARLCSGLLQIAGRYRKDCGPDRTDCAD